MEEIETMSRPITELYRGPDVLASTSLFYGEAFRPVSLNSDGISKAVEAMQSIQIFRLLDRRAREKVDGLVKPLVIPSSLKIVDELVKAQDKL